MLSERRIASLATITPEGMPHLTAVWFLHEDDRFYVSTSSSTAKFRNLTSNRNVALMIDSRDADGGRGISVQGEVEILTGPKAQAIGRKVHARYLTPEALESDVGSAFESFDDVALQITPTKWIGWDMSELDDQMFAGALRSNGWLYELAP